MAMSDDTGSSFAHWAGLYDPEPSPDAGFAADGGTNTVVDVLPAAASPTSAGSGGSPTKSPSSAQPGIEGPRVGKPARRRSRASRRAPVTLLNTDTANFRAMVQQFTGIPAPPPAAAVFGPPLINFAADYGFPPPAGAMASSFDHLHRSHHQHPAAAAPLHVDQLRRQQQQQQYTGAAFGYNGLLQGGVGGGDIFASAEDRMLLQSIQQAAQMPPPPAANNTSLGFFA